MIVVDNLKKFSREQLERIYANILQFAAATNEVFDMGKSQATAADVDLVVNGMILSAERSLMMKYNSYADAVKKVLSPERWAKLTTQTDLFGGDIGTKEFNKQVRMTLEGKQWTTPDNFKQEIGFDEKALKSIKKLAKSDIAWLKNNVEIYGEKFYNPQLIKDPYARKKMLMMKGTVSGITWKKIGDALRIYRKTRGTPPLAETWTAKQTRDTDKELEDLENTTSTKVLVGALERLLTGKRESSLRTMIAAIISGLEWMELFFRKASITGPVRDGYDKITKKMVDLWRIEFGKYRAYITEEGRDLFADGKEEALMIINVHQEMLQKVINLARSIVSEIEKAWELLRNYNQEFGWMHHDEGKK